MGEQFVDSRYWVCVRYGDVEFLKMDVIPKKYSVLCCGEILVTNLCTTIAGKSVASESTADTCVHVTLWPSQLLLAGRRGREDAINF